MTEQMTRLFLSFFANPSVWGIGLAIYFGAFWLIPYYPPLFTRPKLWIIMASSAFLALTAASFVQIPLQFLIGQAMGNLWSQELLMQRILLFGIPQILMSGLVQEGAKLVPMVIYWRSEGKSIDPKVGLVMGAVAGAGFGIFEAQWAHNTILASFNIWEALNTHGISALFGFWERFSAVADHTAFSALAGYGLAKGKGWQFYLVAAFLHSFLNYGVVLLVSHIFTLLQLQIYAFI
jgi:RsiW-degrading membrane proteinase PrsW (M82 family)